MEGQGRIQDFKLEGTHLKKLRRAEGGAKIFGVFRVKNHHFTELFIESVIDSDFVRQNGDDFTKNFWTS
jgi:hypothetical protein